MTQPVGTSSSSTSPTVWQSSEPITTNNLLIRTPRRFATSKRPFRTITSKWRSRMLCVSRRSSSSRMPWRMSATTKERDKKTISSSWTSRWSTTPLRLTTPSCRRLSTVWSQAWVWCQETSLKTTTRSTWFQESTIWIPWGLLLSRGWLIRWSHFRGETEDTIRRALARLLPR